MQLLLPYIRLLRPANIITAFADILAGGAIVSASLASFPNQDIIWLLLATTGLYGGGVVFNDYFDTELDKKERPERPIPSGGATRKNALILGIILFTMGVGVSFLVNMMSGMIALLISLFALLYDAKTKHVDLLGPANMGLCRGLNLLLGMSLIPSAMLNNWYLLLIPIVYIAAITSVSKGEVYGSGKQPLYIAAFFYLLIFAAIVFLGISSDTALVQSLPFALLFLALIFSPLVKAMKDPSAAKIGIAVKMGILSLIVLNATLAAIFAGALYGIIILLLLPASMLLGKFFAVT